LSYRGIDAILALCIDIVKAILRRTLEELLDDSHRRFQGLLRDLLLRGVCGAPAITENDGIDASSC